jgi:hypothetical protein
MRSFVLGCNNDAMCIFSIKQGKDEAKRGSLIKLPLFGSPTFIKQVQGKTNVKKYAAAAVLSQLIGFFVFVIFKAVDVASAVGSEIFGCLTTLEIFFLGPIGLLVRPGIAIGNGGAILFNFFFVVLHKFIFENIA